MAVKLYIGNLPTTITNAQLKQFITNAGFQVTAANVVREKSTGMSWGYGFVDLAEGEDIERVITWLNGRVLDGNTLTVITVKPPGTGFARAPEDTN